MITDNPSGSPRFASLVLDVNAFTGAGSGARVFLALTQTDPACVLKALGSCLPRLQVLAAPWTGDESTVTAPIDPVALLGALASPFPALDFIPFEASPGCLIGWPSQAYLATSSVGAHGSTAPPVEAVLLFGSTVERRAAEGSVLLATYSSDVVAPQLCEAMGPEMRRRAHWVSRDNVMVLVGTNDSGTNSIVDTALNVAAKQGKG